MKKNIRLHSLLLAMFMLLFQVSDLHAQQIASFKVKNASLDECLKEIEKQTGLGYLYKGGDLKSIKGITFSAAKTSVKEVLQAILVNTGLVYEIDNGVILIIQTPKKEVKKSPQDKSKPVSVNLKILDIASKEPIIGATAVIRQYGIYGVADIDGSLVLKNVPAGMAMIEVQMLGFETSMQEFDLEASQNLVISLRPTSLELEEVTVVAKSSVAGTSTSSRIGRQAMDHLQATSLKDIMQLIPGQLVTGVSDMTSAEKITIRTLNTSSANNAFGTSVMVDGIPVSDNASLMDKTSVNAVGATGVDLRQIGADNIESVEVIRGIPSAEYGDLASGAVIVNTKAGFTPYEIRAKINPTSLNTSLGKGWKLGKNGGSLNSNFDYAQAWGDPREKSSSFDRISGGLSYTKTIGRIWYTNTKLNVSSLLDFRGNDPDLIIEGSETTQKALSIRFSHSGRLSLNKRLMRTLSYAFGYNHSFNESRTSTIVSAGGGMPVISAMSTGYYEVPYITDSYKSSGGTIGEPKNLFVKVSNTFTANTKKLHQRFNMGVEYRYEENKAKGFYNDDDNYPLRPNSNGRPRPYYDIPPINQASAFFEDNINWKFGKSAGLKVQAGVRMDMVQPGMPEYVYSISPRLNASLKVNEWLEFRGGWGRNSKTPGLSHLYPEAKYTDREVTKYLPVDQRSQLVMYQTYVTYVERNNKLKNATNTKAEIGFDIKLPNEMTLSVVAYRDYMPNGFGSFSEYRTYLSNYYTAQKGLVINQGSKPTVDWNNPARTDTVFTTSGRIGNTQASLDRGVEFDFYFGQIKAIRTSFYLSGAYMETKNWQNGPNYSNPEGILPSSVYGQGGVNTPPFKLEYPTGLQKDIQRRFSTVLRAVCNIPQLKMVASFTGQVIWYNYSNTTNQKSSPIGWIDTDLSYHEITTEMLNDPEYRIKGLLLKDQIRDPKDIEPTIQKPIWIINGRLQKDISQSLGFSFFVNNVFFYTPYQSSTKSGTLTERNLGTFSFGMELIVKL